MVTEPTSLKDLHLIDITKEQIDRIGKRQCPLCGTPMKMGYDSITKKKSKYLWDFQCRCSNLQLALC